MSRTFHTTAFTILFGVAFISVAGGAESNLAQLRERAKQLQSRMLGRPCTSDPWIDCMRDEIAELRVLLRDYTVAKLNQSAGDTGALIEDLRTVDDVYAFGLTGKPNNWDGRPPFVFSQDLPGGELLITVNHFAAGALYAPPGLVIIQGFRKVGDTYFFGGENGDSISGIMNYRTIEALRPARSREIWLLVCGQVAGLQGQYIRARIFGFDGHEVKELWAPEDREAMKISVLGDEIEARFLGPKTYRFAGDRQDVMQEKLRLTVGGVVRFGPD
jgi:hypothetical protein